MLKARHRLALIERAEREQKWRNENGEITMKAKVETILMLTLILAFLMFSLPQQTLADEEYVYPVIETNCEQINVTAYRFHNGDTLNFNFNFTIQEGVLASFPEHYTDYGETEKTCHLNKSVYLDDRRTSRSYCGLGVKGSGSTWNEHIITVRETGDHTIKWEWLFTVDEDAEGYLDINFLSEVNLKLEKLPTSPFPTQCLLTVGAVGGACVAIVGATFFVYKRRNKRLKEKP